MRKSSLENLNDADKSALVCGLFGSNTPINVKWAKNPPLGSIWPHKSTLGRKSLKRKGKYLIMWKIWLNIFNGLKCLLVTFAFPFSPLSTSFFFAAAAAPFNLFGHKELGQNMKLINTKLIFYGFPGLMSWREKSFYGLCFCAEKKTIWTWERDERFLYQPFPENERDLPVGYNRKSFFKA